MKTAEIDNILTILLNTTPRAAPARRRMLARLRNAAATELVAAAQRSPRRPTPAALTRNDEAIVFLLELRGDPEVSEREERCALLLRWCIEAEEQGLSYPLLVRIASLIRDVSLPDRRADEADLERMRELRRQQNAFRAKGEAKSKYTPEQRREWRALRRTSFANQSMRSATVNIARRLGLPDSSHASIRAELQKMAKPSRS